MTALERVVHLAWMMGNHIIHSNIVARGEIVLCRNGKPVRYAPYDCEIEFDDKLTSFTVANEDYDLVLMNACDYNEMSEEE